jgi:tetratricopeptide (TPR) repeat protein
MKSIIEGYEYDIFISYRQKDNKYDGWVTEFVENLKRELEATFKEEISVYFDINPHDGLLETHDVDASLKEKLKCLVFIPIISRTYCDPKSFAWEHEFMAFIEQASQDQFGLKIKLPSGNVASRVLPVRIHDLENKDLMLCESSLGGYLRGVEFIFRSPGVNRPLRAKEDNLHDNLNHTIYRDQINKVANAVNEIIFGLIGLQNQNIDLKEKESYLSAVNDDNQDTEFPVSQQPVTSRYVKKNRVFKIWRKKRVIYSLSSVGVLLAAIAFFLFSSGSSMPFVERDWIVITDFENHTEDSVYDRSLYTAFSLTISQSRYINLFPRSRMIETLSRMEIMDMVFIDDKTGREIATREGIGIYLVPGIGEVGNSYVIAAEIFETKTGNLLKSVVVYAQTRDEILAKLDQLSKRIRRDLGESRFSIASQDKPLSKVTTSSLEALKQYSLGTEHLKMADFTGAKDYYENALLIDPDFTAAKASLGNLHIEHFNPAKGRELLDQAVQSADNLTDREKYGIMALHAVNVENNITKGIEYTRILAELYPDDPIYRNNLGFFFMRSGQYEKSLKEYKTAVRINPRLPLAYAGICWLYIEHFGRADSTLVWAEKMVSRYPRNPWGYLYLGNAYLCSDSVAKAESAYRQAREFDPDLLLNLWNLAHSCRIQGKYREAISILDDILEKNQAEKAALYNLGVNYYLLGDQKEADNNFSMFKKIVWEDWMKRWPDHSGTYISAASVAARLGEKEISEQMLRKAIEIDPTSHFRFSGVLCVQGKIPEALDQLEKALENGYRNLIMLKIDPNLHILQYDVRFLNLIDKYFWEF